MKQNNLKQGKCNIIGVTGGVGAGKSTVLDYIGKNYNCLIIFADEVANTIKKKGYPAYERLTDLLGKEILGDDEEIDRSRMAAAIFGSKELLDKVNNILHPLVNDYIIKTIEEHREKNEKDFVFVEAALLIENGYEALVDELWYVYADENIRRERLKASRGYSDEKIDSIFRSQLGDDEFRKHADFCIDNSGSTKEAALQIDNRIGEWKNNGKLRTSGTESGLRS